MAGEDKAIELVLNKIWELRNVGISTIIIGHTKKRDVEDIVTGTTYTTLTTNMSQRYFNAIKTKLHILGVAYIDREIVQQKTGKKNIVTKKEEIKGKVISESRRIAFRDDNYNIDSKSRFADIVDTVPLDSDAFIAAVNDAIASEHSKSGMSITESKKKQAEQSKEQKSRIQQDIDAKIEKKRNVERNATLIDDIKSLFPKASDQQKLSVKKTMAEHGFSRFSDDNIPTAALETISEILKG